MLQKHQEEMIKCTLEPFEPRMIGVFGSYARNENRVDSDLDLLVDFEKDIDLLDLVGMRQDLSEELGIKVDLITKRSLNPSIRPYVNKDLIRIL